MNPTDPTAAATSTMRAVTLARYGTPADVTVGIRPVPEPGPDEVRVRVRAAGIDAGTLHLVTGTPYLMRVMGFGFRGPRGGRLGLAFAGDVAAVGSAVTAFSPGDRVVGSQAGALAEFVCAPASAIVPIPDPVGYGAAATLPISGVTAIQAVRDVARVRAGQRVLVIGAGGGVGSFAVQLAVTAGATVTAVCSGAKAEFVRGLGASEVIDHTQTDITAAGRRWDAIIDLAGNRRLSRLRSILAPRGTLVLVGGENGGAILGGMERMLGALLLTSVTRQRLRGLASRERAADLADLAAQVAAGTLAPAIDTGYPLDRVGDALRHVATARARGKVLVAL